MYIYIYIHVHIYYNDNNNNEYYLLICPWLFWTPLSQTNSVGALTAIITKQ